jgi:hypothetical protein
MTDPRYINPNNHVCNQSASRTFVLSPLRNASTRLPARSALVIKHVRFVNTDKEELGGVGGSEPPGPQKNPVNWWAADRTNVRFFNCRLTNRKAGTITAVGVVLAGLWMLRAKSKELHLKV